MGGDALVSAAILAQTLAQVAEFTALTASVGTVTAAVVANTTAYTTYEAAAGVAAGVEVAAHVVQMIRNYDDGVDAINERDSAIDDQINFMQQLQDLKTNQDLPMLLCKRDVLDDLIIPTINFCAVDFFQNYYSDKDGLAIDGKSRHLSQQSLGVPSGWLLHDGHLKSMKSSGYIQGIEKNASKRRVEQLRKNKTRLVRNAHATIKSEYSSGDILNKYAQTATIHAGLADLYMQGFNSAGAALGIALGKLAGNPTGGQSGGGSN